MQDIHQDKILILDFGSQYTQLIARRIRELKVYCEIFPYDVDALKIKAFKPKGIILSGGPQSASSDVRPQVPDSVFELGIPLLGICYGMQVMAAQLGGEVVTSSKREFGHAQIAICGDSLLFNHIHFKEHNPEGHTLNVWMSHGDKVEALPQGFMVIASTPNAPIAAISNEQKRYFGVQFHPEVTHSEKGLELLQQFVYQICECQALWQTENIIYDAIHDIQQKVGQDRVILGLSGGVDSSVVAALLHQAIGDRLTCIFVDTGLLRKNEANEVLETFSKHFGIDIICVNAEQEFLNALNGEACPEKKRKIIGQSFIDVFEREAKKLKGVKWLAQGTIYPDVIESSKASESSTVIKSHHNVGGLPQRLPFQLIEPLRELFKDEVRQIGLELGLAKEMVTRHPFPGPGLGVRILGEVKKSYAELLRHADSIFIEELRHADLYHKVSQAFVVFLPVKSVGVMGDGRKYDYVVALRAVETIDFMTARWAHLPHSFLEKVSNRIINEVDGISRVTYDISGKPPATIEWE